jgi:hypothetical protein
MNVLLVVQTLKKSKFSKPPIEPEWLLIINDDLNCLRQLLEDHFQGPTPTIEISDDRNVAFADGVTFKCCSRCTAREEQTAAEKAMETARLDVDSPGDLDMDVTTPAEPEVSSGSKRKRSALSGPGRKPEELVAKLRQILFA